MSIKDKMKAKTESSAKTRAQQARDAYLASEQSATNTKSPTDQATTQGAASPDIKKKDTTKPTTSNQGNQGNQSDQKPAETHDSTNKKTEQPNSTETDTVQTNENKGEDKVVTKQEVVESPTPAYLPKRRKKERMTDTHTSQAYYVQNDILAVMNEIVGDEWGGKYRLVNDALKLYIHTFHKEYVDKIKDLP